MRFRARLCCTGEFCFQHGDRQMRQQSRDRRSCLASASAKAPYRHSRRHPARQSRFSGLGQCLPPSVNGANQRVTTTISDLAAAPAPSRMPGEVVALRPLTSKAREEAAVALNTSASSIHSLSRCRAPGQLQMHRPATSSAPGGPLGNPPASRGGLRVRQSRRPAAGCRDRAGEDRSAARRPKNSSAGASSPSGSAQAGNSTCSSSAQPPTAARRCCSSGTRTPGAKDSRIRWADAARRRSHAGHVGMKATRSRASAPPRSRLAPAYLLQPLLKAARASSSTTPGQNFVCMRHCAFLLL